MKGLVLVICLTVAAMLLSGCAYKSPAASDQQGFPEGKPTAPAAPITGEKEAPIKPMTPPAPLPDDGKNGALGDDSQSIGDNGAMQKDTNDFPNMSLPKTIDKICLDKIKFDAYCSNLNDTKYQIPEADGIPRGRGYEEVYLKNIYTAESEYPNPVNCTLQFIVTPHNGSAPRYSQVYRATLGPGEIAGPYRQNYSYNLEESDNNRTGTTWVNECEDYPG
jgi:hypothetical protein